MKRPRLRTILLIALALPVALYVTAAIWLALKGQPPVPDAAGTRVPETVVIFGASGTAGDGILEAAMAAPGIRSIHVITRRATPRIEAGVASGRVRMTLHTDYLDYSAIHETIADADAVFWAIGISSLGMEQPEYARIHVDFPARFLGEWMQVSRKPAASFHYISSSDIAEDASAMWAREKWRAEQTLFAMAEGSPIRVVAYRPDYIGPTEAEASVTSELLHGFFRPIGAAQRATEIGAAMIEAAARPAEFEHRALLGTRKIIRYAKANARRAAQGQ